MPVIKHDHQWIENYEDIFEIFKEVNETQPDAFRDKTRRSGLRCFTGIDENAIIDFWMGMQLEMDGGEKWKSIYNPSVYLTDISLKVFSVEQKCVYNLGGKPEPDRYEHSEPVFLHFT